MPDYRVYLLDDAGHIVRPPIILQCATDRELPERLAAVPDVQTLDVWDGARHVMRVERSRET